MKKQKMILICSGGLDSISWGLINLDKYDQTLMVFDYGQKAKREQAAAVLFSSKYNLPRVEIDIAKSSGIFGRNQLTDFGVDILPDYTETTIVPLRNGLLLQFAMCFAYAHNFNAVGLGCKADDRSPDCSPQFLCGFSGIMRLGVLPHQTPVHVATPAQNGFRKTDLIHAAYDIDKEMLFASWSCYANKQYQCGICNSCFNRREAFKEAGINDETIYEV